MASTASTRRRFIDFREPVADSPHPPCITAYRRQTTGLCPTEAAALDARAHQRIQFGDSAFWAITRTCADIKCDAEAHWCRSCMIAPRCSCLGVHMAPDIDEDGSRKWYVDQPRHAAYLAKNVCDDRIATFVNQARNLARDHSYATLFCAKCTSTIIFNGNAVLNARGRTYRELASYLLAALEGNVCTACQFAFATAPCANLGARCPSGAVPFTFDIIVNCRSRRYGESKVDAEIKTPKDAVTYPKITPRQPPHGWPVVALPPLTHIGPQHSHNASPDITRTAPHNTPPNTTHAALHNTPPHAPPLAKYPPDWETGEFSVPHDELVTTTAVAPHSQLATIFANLPTPGPVSVSWVVAGWRYTSVDGSDPEIERVDEEDSVPHFIQTIADYCYSGVDDPASPVRVQPVPGRGNSLPHKSIAAAMAAL